MSNKKKFIAAILNIQVGIFLCVWSQASPKALLLQLQGNLAGSASQERQ